MHAIRTQKYKFIRYQGVRDVNELYDIENDPMEMNNLIRNPEYADIARDSRTASFQWFRDTESTIMYLRSNEPQPRFDYGCNNTY